MIHVALEKKNRFWTAMALARLCPFTEARNAWFYKPFVFKSGVFECCSFQPTFENSDRLW